MSRISRPSPALVVACIALLVALGGTSIAAVNQLAANSVGTSQLKNNAVVTAKIKSGGVTASDIAANAVVAAKIASNAVVAAKIASNAVTSAKIAGNAVNSAKVQDGSLVAADLAAGTIPAPTDAFVRFQNGPFPVPGTSQVLATLAIPQAGNYLLSAKAYFSDTGQTSVVTCRLQAEGDFDESRVSPAGVSQPETISHIVGHVFAAAGGSANFACSATGTGTTAHMIKIAAIKVGNLTNTG
jgi:hypothetical protein